MRTPAPIHRTLLAILLVAVAGLSLAASAAAVAPGRNGRIAFTSGREGATDNGAQLYTLNSSRPTLLSSPFGLPAQNRHPSWSPDRTKVVFASGTPGTPTTEEFDLYVKDMVTGSVAPLDSTQVNDGLSSDHPAWSHDGTRIAYDHQPADNSAERNIKIKTVGSSAPASDFTLNAPVEFKPAWSPDDETLYFARTDTTPAVNFNIYKKPAAGGSQTPVAADPGIDEYQPAISPDGSKICYTRQSTLQNSATANITVANLPGLDGAQTFSPDPTKGDINCVFSPDGKKIAYVNGTFGQGRLVMKAVAAAPGDEPTELADDQGSNNFDGNPDWARDGSPDCPDQTVTTPPNTPVTIQLECTDTGPAYERTDPNGFVTSDGQPRNGTTSDESNTTNPSTVKYTPKAGFTGTDRVAYSAFDDFGFGTDNGTVTIQVRAPAAAGGNAGDGSGAGTARPKCAGRTATIVGTRGNDRIRGTRRRDVIVAGRGDDRVRAGGGNDIVCAGTGRDRVSGGRGNDRIAGEAGNDRLAGDTGRDRLNGGRGRDRLNGGRGRDSCAGGPGRDRASCERKRSI